MCLVDCDAQGSMTIALGYKEPDRFEVTLATLLSEIMEEEEFVDESQDDSFDGSQEDTTEETGQEYEPDS